MRTNCRSTIFMFNIASDVLVKCEPYCIIIRKKGAIVVNGKSVRKWDQPQRTSSFKGTTGIDFVHSSFIVWLYIISDKRYYSNVHWFLCSFIITSEGKVFTVIRWQLVHERERNMKVTIRVYSQYLRQPLTFKMVGFSSYNDTFIGHLVVEMRIVPCVFAKA